MPVARAPPRSPPSREAFSALLSELPALIKLTDPAVIDEPTDPVSIYHDRASPDASVASPDAQRLRKAWRICPPASHDARLKPRTSSWSQHWKRRCRPRDDRHRWDRSVIILSEVVADRSQCRR